MGGIRKRVSRNTLTPGPVTKISQSCSTNLCCSVNVFVGIIDVTMKNS